MSRGHQRYPCCMSVMVATNRNHFTHHSVDEWGHEALGIAVASTIVRPGLAMGAQALAAILEHLGEVESAVHTARQL